MKVWNTTTISGTVSLIVGLIVFGLTFLHYSPGFNILGAFLIALGAAAEGYSYGLRAAATKSTEQMVKA
jgi:uncharacterized membrane protein HdeD (DUF308 family)